VNKIPPVQKCPRCENAEFRRWSLPHPLILHWILNPALAFNEIVLGQRLPKTQLICKSCDGPLLERSYVPCPSCGAMHLGRLHSGKQAFGNWRGIACPACKEEIPCIWNIFSLLILLLTSPFWAPLYYVYFRGKPLRPMFQTENGKSPALKPVTKRKWILLGSIWGGLMWLFLSLLPALNGKGDARSWTAAILGIPLWTCGGILWGFGMWFFMGRAAGKRNPI